MALKLHIKSIISIVNFPYCQRYIASATKQQPKISEVNPTMTLATVTQTTEIAISTMPHRIKCDLIQTKCTQTQIKPYIHRNKDALCGVKHEASKLEKHKRTQSERYGRHSEEPRRPLETAAKDTTVARRSATLRWFTALSIVHINSSSDSMPCVRVMNEIILHVQRIRLIVEEARRFSVKWKARLVQRDRRCIKLVNYSTRDIRRAATILTFVIAAYTFGIYGMFVRSLIAWF